MTWIVYDLIDGWDERYETLEDAQAAAAHALDNCLDDVWHEDTENLYIAKITHAPVKTVVASRDDMGEEEWEERYGYTDEVDEVWEYDIRPVDPEPAELTLKRVRDLITHYREFERRNKGYGNHLASEIYERVADRLEEALSGDQQ